MRSTPSSRLSRWLVVTAVLLAGLAAILAGSPRVAVSAGAGVAVSGVLANLPSPPPAVQASGWVVGTDAADGYGVILHTTNDGQLWVRQGSTSDVPNVELNNVKAVDRHVVWVVGNADSGYGVILRTSDAGLTWVRQGGPATVPDGAIFGVGPVDRERAWVVGQAGTILRTDDGGLTWTQQTSGTTANLYEVSAIDGQTAWIIGSEHNGYATVLHTTNGGQTWKRQGTAATLGAGAFIDLTVANPHTAWAVGGQDYVVKTTNGGATWHVQMGPGLSDNNGACAVDRHTAWIATDYNTVFRTTSGGTTWNRHNLTLSGDFYLLGVSALGQASAWVVGGAVFPATGGVILHTTDAGITWQTQSTPVDVTFRRTSFFVPTPTLTVRLSGLKSGAVKLGGRVTAKGTVTTTSLAGSKVRLAVQKKQCARWVTVRVVKRTIAATGAFSWTFVPHSRGAYRLRATLPRTTAYAVVRTPWRTFKVK